jgi:hypothetical protein
MVMFEHFTIGAPACRAGSTSYEISPCDTRSSSPSSQLASSDIKQTAQSTVPELASQLDVSKAQKIHISSSCFCTSPSPLDASKNKTLLPVDLTIDSEFENELTIDTEYENNSKSAPNSPPSFSMLRLCRRLQRQLNSQLLYTRSQIEAISELVEEMVSTKSQCNITTPSVNPQSLSGPSDTSMLEDPAVDDDILPGSMDDEGFCEGGVEDGDLIDADALLMNIRRVSAPSGIRRQQEYGKGAVFAKPRMRRNILRRKRLENRVENPAETGT